MRRTLGFGPLALGLALLLAACGGGGGGGGGGNSDSVNTPGGRVSLSLQGGSFQERPTVQSVTPPPGMEAPYGAIAFTATVPQAGGTLTVTLTFPNPIPEGAMLGKRVSGEWQILPDANLDFGGTTATYTVRDGSPLDGDGQADGRVVDPVALLVPNQGTGTEPSSWTIRNMDDPIVGLVYGEGVYVAVTDYHAFFYSRNGMGWTPMAGVSDAGDYPVYGDGIFLAFARSSSAYYRSEDGIHWEALAGEGEGPILYYYRADSSVDYFVRAGGDGLYRSQDGRTWERFAAKPSDGFTLLSPRYLQSSILLGRTGNGTVYYSLDGGHTWGSVPWTVFLIERLIGLRGNLLLEVWGPSGPSNQVRIQEITPSGVVERATITLDCTVDVRSGYPLKSAALPMGFLIPTTCGTYFSADGYNWWKVSDELFNAMAQGPGTQVVMGNTMGDLWLWDGVGALQRVGFPYDLNSFAITRIRFLGGEFWARSYFRDEQGRPGYKLFRSGDGASWSITTPVNPPVDFVQAEGRVYFLTGDKVIDADGRVLWENDDPYVEFYALAYGRGRFVAVGSDGYVATGTLEGGWQKVQAASGKRLEGVEYIEALGEFWAVGQGVALKSNDGVAWEGVQLPLTSTTLYDIAYGNGALVISGGFLFVSRDGGRTWTIPPYTRSPGSRAVAFCDGYFVSVGVYGEIAYSEDGQRWSLAKVLDTNPHADFYNFSDLYDVACGNGRFVAVGSRGAIITSP